MNTLGYHYELQPLNYQFHKTRPNIPLALMFFNDLIKKKIKIRLVTYMH